MGFCNFVPHMVLMNLGGFAGLMVVEHEICVEETYLHTTHSKKQNDSKSNGVCTDVEEISHPGCVP